MHESRSELLLRKYVEGDDKHVLKLLKRDGRKEKDLCVQILQYFVNKCTNTKDINIENTVKYSNNKNQTNGDSDDDDDDDDDADRYVCNQICNVILIIDSRISILKNVNFVLISISICILFYLLSLMFLSSLLFYIT